MLLHQITKFIFLLSAIAITATACVHPKLQAQQTTPIRPKTILDTLQPKNHHMLKKYLVAVEWDQLPDWHLEQFKNAIPAFIYSCQRLQQARSWQRICQYLPGLKQASAATIRRFMETFLTPYRLTHTVKKNQGLLTGYYEPLLQGSYQKKAPYLYPIHGIPPDLVIQTHQEKTLYTRADPSKPNAPYYSRQELQTSGRLNGHEIVWLQDPVDAFFLHIQGSGKIQLPSGRIMRVGFAAKNGHPYRSISPYLDQLGLLPLYKSSQGNIKKVLKKHPHLLNKTLWNNPSYIFFREIIGLKDYEGPIGALGVSLTALRSIAVDSSLIPLGLPMFLSSQYPASQQPLNRLVFAQDTGSAITGYGRADFYWGSGNNAAILAEGTKYPAQFWLLLPKSD